MKTSEKNIEELFDFKGSWDIPSSCGLRCIEKEDGAIVIVTELYKENSGSSITSVSASLAMQIAGKYGFDPEQMIYIECSPDMHSKLSFYDEKYYLVKFSHQNGVLSNPQWEKLSKEDFRTILAENA